MDSNKSEIRHNAKLAHKYRYVRHQIITNYKKGCKILEIVKWVFAGLFVLFTVIAVKACQTAPDKTIWLVFWVVIILLEINLFVITDYCKYLMKEKVIPYLLDDNQLEFGEFKIFMDIDLDEEEEEEDE